MDYYTVKDACEKLGVDRSTIARYLRNGKIKGFRLNDTGRWRIDKVSFDAFCGGSTGQEANI